MRIKLKFGGWVAIFSQQRLRPLHSVTKAIHKAQRLERLGNHRVLVAVPRRKVLPRRLALQTAWVLDFNVIGKHVKPYR